MRGKEVEGVVYPSGAKVSRKPADWRANYPADQFRRTTENGETFYHSRRRQAVVNGTLEWIDGRIVAEVYAIIPEGK